MDLLNWHLSYLKSMLTPPTTYGWWPHVERRAKDLASDPELAALPALVLAEYERIRNVSKSSGLKASSTTK